MRNTVNPIASAARRVIECVEENSKALDNLAQTLSKLGNEPIACIAETRRALRQEQRRLTRKILVLDVAHRRVKGKDPTRADLLCGNIPGIIRALHAELLEPAADGNQEPTEFLYPQLSCAWQHWLQAHQCNPTTLPAKLADVVKPEALKGYRLKKEWEWCAAPALSEISALLSARAVEAQALVNITRARGENTAAAEAAAFAAAEAFTRAESRAEAAHKELDLRAGISSAPAPAMREPRKRPQLPRFMKASAQAR